jgi:hypothetical protein
MKKVTLPCHEALWTALVAVDLSNQRAKSFSELLSDSRKEFKSTRKHSSPQNSSRLPFSHEERTTSFAPFTNQVRYSKPVMLTYQGVNAIQNIYEGATEATTAIAAIAQLGLVGAACNTLENAVTAIGHNPIGQIKTVLYGLAKTTYYAQKAMTFYDLTPANGEFDPDYCTCSPKIGLIDPCQQIAKTILKMKEGNVVGSAMNVATLGLKSLAHPLYKLLAPKPSAPSERFLSNKKDMAHHLWKAAQSFGKYTGPKEYDAENALLGIIPGITVHPQGRGCPKAISTIAALFREFHAGSNYLQTLSAISATDGAYIIENRI